MYPDFGQLINVELFVIMCWLKAPYVKGDEQISHIVVSRPPYFEESGDATNSRDL